MKKIIILLALVGSTTLASAQSKADIDAITKTVNSYVLAGDQNDITSLESLLHKEYRVLMHTASKDETAVVPRAVYIDKIKSKEWGGDTRQLSILNIDVYQGNTAEVKVALDGAMNMRNYLSLVKTSKGWQLVQDMVFISPKGS